MNALMIKLLCGLVTGVGALVRSVWGYLNLLQESKSEGKVLKFDWLKLLTSTLPSLLAGFAAGYVMDVAAPDFVMLFLSGAGLSSLQSKI